MTRVALDTNLLVYAQLNPDDSKGLAAQSLIARATSDGVVPVQVLGEFLRVVQRNRPDRLTIAMALIESYTELFTTPPTTVDILTAAAALSRDHRLQFWDAVIITAATGAGAEVLMTEDLQDGRVVGGLRILNPFHAENAASVDALFPA